MKKVDLGPVEVYKEFEFPNVLDIVNWLAYNVRKIDQCSGSINFCLDVSGYIYDTINTFAGFEYFDGGYINFDSYRIPVHVSSCLAKGCAKLYTTKSEPDYLSLVHSMILTKDQLHIKKVIYNDPATIILWGDGTKTVVRCQEGDIYSPTTGFLMCYVKKLLGNSSRKINDLLKEWEVKDEE